MNSKRNKYLVVVVAGLIAFFLLRMYVFRAPLQTVNASPEYKGTSKELSFLVTEDIDYWANRYVQIKGVITETTKNGVILEDIMYCQFQKGLEINDYQDDDSITLKGRVVGFDELLMEIKINQCIIIE